MSQNSYLNRIATARSTRPATTSQDAYAQVDRMAKSTNGQFTMKASGDSSALVSESLPAEPLLQRILILVGKDRARLQRALLTPLL